MASTPGSADSIASEHGSVKRILVGLDGSGRAAGVLDAAVVLARGYGARIVVIRAVGLSPEVPQDFYKTTDGTVLDALCIHARQEIEARISRIPPELLAVEGVEIVVGVPWDAVCQVARRIRADLVVIGSHGYRGLDYLLGTTAAKVVNHAPCSVLVVRDPLPVEAAP
jgi:nucleotide-binding universal stress UspA family protein